MFKTIDPFCQSNIALVWRETLRVVGEWFSEIDSAVESEQIATVDLKDVTQVNPFSAPLTSINLLLHIQRSPSS